MSRSSLVTHLLLIVFGVALAVAGLEVALRVAGAGGPSTLEPLFDREVVELLPEKGSNRPRRRKLGQFKVAVIGDSFTRGDGVAWDDTYALRLGRLLNLNADAPIAEVRVWAHNGFNTHDELQYLPRVMRWKPNLLILGVFLNDSEDREDPRLFELREALLPRVPEGWWRSVLLRSRGLAWISSRLDVIRQRRAAQAYSDLIYDPESSGWRKFEAALDEFVRVTRQHEVPLVAVLFPNLDAIGPFHEARGHEQMREALASRSIDTLVLRDVFADTASVRMTVYPGVDGHPTEIAHRLVARRLLEFLLDHRYLPRVYLPNQARVVRNREEWLRRIHRYQDVLYYEP